MAVSADVYGPYDAGAGANWTEDSWRKMMRHLRLTDGVLRGITANDLLPFGDSTGMQVKVPTGEAFIRGHWAEVTSQKTLAIATAHASLPRIDRVIARNDFVGNKIELDVLTGTPNASPVAPSITQNTSMWEIRLAKVSVAAAASTITAANVTDDRDTADGPHCRYIQANNQSISNATATKLKFDGTPQRTHPDIVVTGTGNTDFAVQKIGRWEVKAQVRFGATGGLERSLIVNVAGVEVSLANTAPSIGCTLNLSTDVYITSAPSTISIQFYHDNGSASSTNATYTNMSLKWLGY